MYLHLNQVHFFSFQHLHFLTFSHFGSYQQYLQGLSFWPTVKRGHKAKRASLVWGTRSVPLGRDGRRDPKTFRNRIPLMHLIKTVIKTSSTGKEIDEFKMKLYVRFEHPNNYKNGWSCTLKWQTGKIIMCMYVFSNVFFGKNTCLGPLLKVFFSDLRFQNEFWVKTYFLQ